MVFFGEHVGVRGEIRYYRSFQILDFVNVPNLSVLGLGGRNSTTVAPRRA